MAIGFARWLWGAVVIVAVIAYTGWSFSQPIDRRVLSEGIVELTGSTLVIISGAVLALVLLGIGAAGIWRRRRGGQPGGPIGLVYLFVGGLMGLFAVLTAAEGVLRLTPVGVTGSAPKWLGGKTQVELVYAQIEWLRKRDGIVWEIDPRQTNPLTRLIGMKPAWRKKPIEECLVRLKGAEETLLDLGFQVKGACDEILRAAQTAGVTIKPVERFVQPKPTDR